MKHIKGYKVFESNTDDYYKEITIDYIIDNIPKDRFIDIDNNSLGIMIELKNIAKRLIEIQRQIRLFVRKILISYHKNKEDL